jgi:hypothetical protein
MNRFTQAGLRTFIALFGFNPIAWVCVPVVVWGCDFPLLTALNAVFCGSAVSAYFMWVYLESNTALVAFAAPVVIYALSHLGISPIVLNGIFLTVGINAAYQLGKLERWFTYDPALGDARW